MVYFSGIIGSLLLSLCAVPQAYWSWKTKDSSGISWIFLLMWLFGELFTFIYVVPKKDYPLLLNYVLNIVCICVILRYKL